MKKNALDRFLNSVHLELTKDKEQPISPCARKGHTREALTQSLGAGSGWTLNKLTFRHAAVVLSLFVMLHVLLPAVHLVAYASNSLTLEVSRNKLAVGETFDLTLRFQGMGTGDFVLKLPAGLRSLGESTSSSFRMVNGESSSETALIYEVLAEKEGSFELGPFETKVSGKKYSSNAVVLQVTPPQVSGRGGGTAGASASGNEAGSMKGDSEPLAGEAPFSISVQVSKPIVYVGEQIYVTIELQNPEDRAHVQYRELSFPELAGFMVEDLGKPQTSSELKNGVRHTAARIVKRLTPLKAGVTEVDGVRAVADILTPSRRRSQGGFFGSLMTEYDRQTKALSAAPVSITVQALPDEGRPSDFSGLVGDTSWSIDFPARGEVNTGDSVTLTVSVASTGDLSGVNLPSPQASGGVKIYPDNPQVRMERRGDKLFQVKDYKFACVFTRPGNSVFGPIRLSFFSPSEGKYQTLEYAFPPVRVQGPDMENSAAIGQGDLGQRVDTHGSASPEIAGHDRMGQGAGGGDLFPIKSDLSDFQSSSVTRQDVWLAIAFPAFSFLFYALAAGSQRFRERLPLLSRLMRKRGALAKALAELRKLSKASQSHSGIKIADKCSDALRIVKEYLGSRTEQSLTQKTNAELQEILGNTLSPDFFTLLSELEAQVYSSGNSGRNETQNFIETTRKLELQLKQMDSRL